MGSKAPQSPPPGPKIVPSHPPPPPKVRFNEEALVGQSRIDIIHNAKLSIFIKNLTYKIWSFKDDELLYYIIIISADGEYLEVGNSYWFVVPKDRGFSSNKIFKVKCILLKLSLEFYNHDLDFSLEGVNTTTPTTYNMSSYDVLVKTFHEQQQMVCVNVFADFGGAYDLAVDSINIDIKTLRNNLKDCDKTIYHNKMLKLDND